jgi:MFS family permease
MDRHRQPRTNVRLLALGRLISVTGGAAAFAALNYTVWDLTRSPVMQSIALLLTFGVTGLVGPFAGALGDRFDRRRVMVVSEAVAALCYAGMAFVSTPVALIGFAFAAAVAELPFFSASRAAIPNLVESDADISWANSLVMLGVHAGIAIGPVIGGVLLGVVGNPSWVFAINAVTFVVSLGLTLLVRGSFQESRATANGGQEAADVPTEHAGLAAGIRFLFADRVLRRLSIAYLIFLLGMGIGMVADAPLATAFGAGGTGYGLLIAAWGTGSVVGALAGRWMTARTEPMWLVGGTFGISAAAFAVGFAPAFPLILISLLAMGTADGLAIVAENGIMQRRTPDAVRSRVTASFEAVLSIGLAVAYLAAGPILRMVEPQSAYRIGGATALIAAVLLVPLLRLRRDDAVGSTLGTATPDRAADLPAVEALTASAAPPRYHSAEVFEAADVVEGSSVLTDRGA